MNIKRKMLLVGVVYLGLRGIKHLQKVVDSDEEGCYPSKFDWAPHDYMFEVPHIDIVNGILYPERQMRISDCVEILRDLHFAFAKKGFLTVADYWGITGEYDYDRFPIPGVVNQYGWSTMDGFDIEPVDDCYRIKLGEVEKLNNETTIGGLK